MNYQKNEKYVRNNYDYIFYTEGVNVKEPQYNVNPKLGEVFQNQPKVREAYPDEIPR